MKTKYLYHFFIAALLSFICACAQQRSYIEETMTFENINASEYEEELNLNEQESDNFISSAFFNYYGFAYPYYTMPYASSVMVDPYGFYPVAAYTYGFADYYNTPVSIELPAFADFPVYRYEHPFYAPYIFESLYFDDDE